MVNREHLEARQSELRDRLTICDSQKLKGGWTAVAGSILFVGNLTGATGPSNGTLATLSLIAVIVGQGIGSRVVAFDRATAVADALATG